ncbi:unnamed protein product [Vitrella brassicaformis CCMP3155]|uniref:Uncharacterized protein n=1 Tax=Vitrella brassicaformis (strain CCMP3155) TaxID=1169540 RepID=A0A0G4H4M8_VITBC|nr:unnamed protein product [Vitrella brassicaformis CCMP3155]|eukprot:CEM38748.1 unnamed protein product [Vitrella brassicaformis CCMP3155]
MPQNSSVWSRSQFCVRTRPPYSLMQQGGWRQPRPPDSDGRVPSSSGYSAEEPDVGRRPVGLLYSHYVYADGHGGYAVEVGHKLRPLEPSAVNQIIMFADVHRTADPLSSQEPQQQQAPLQSAVTPMTAGGAIGSNGGGAALRQRQESSSAASSNGDGFVRLPSGARHRVVQEGTGRVPTANNRVKYDEIGWFDAFDGQVKYIDERGRVGRVSNLPDWLREAMLSMREGETRQIIGRAGYYHQLRLVSIE